LKNYILRIYQHSKNNPRQFVGLLEEPERKGKRAFTNFQELWEILNPDHQDEKKVSQCHRLSPENRRHARRDVVFFTGYAKGLQSDESVSNGVITNISKSGICLLTPEVLNDGEKIFIRCSNNSSPRKAVVRWSKKYKDCHFRSGVGFEG